MIIAALIECGLEGLLRDFTLPIRYAIGAELWQLDVILFDARAIVKCTPFAACFCFRCELYGRVYLCGVMPQTSPNVTQASRTQLKNG